MQVRGRATYENLLATKADNDEQHLDKPREAVIDSNAVSKKDEVKFFLFGVLYTTFFFFIHHSLKDVYAYA